MSPEREIEKETETITKPVGPYGIEVITTKTNEPKPEYGHLKDHGEQSRKAY